MKPSTTTSGRISALAETRRQALPDLWEHMRSMLKDSLFKNGLALISNAALTSILGFLFWVIAARLYSSQAVGLGAVMISTMQVLANLSQLNLGNFLNRFLPASGSRASRVILMSYATGIVASFLFASTFVFLSDWLFPQIGSVLDEPTTAAAFIISAVAWTVFALQDSTLSGLRQSVWVPIENSIYAIVKLGLLFVFVGTSLQAMGVFAAWNTPIIAVIIATNLLIFVRLLPKANKKAATLEVPGFRKFTGLMGWDYLGTVAIMSTIGIAPLMVLEFAGPTATAGYHICWAITYSLYLISRSMGISMVVECSVLPERARALVAEAIIYSTLPLAGIVAVLVIGAPWVLMLFGPAYVEANTTLLRLLVLSSVPWGLVTLYVAVARSRGRTLPIAVIQASTLALVFATGYVLLPKFGAVGMAAAWLVTHLSVLFMIIAFEFWRSPDRFVLTMAMLVSSMARFISSFKSRFFKPSAAVSLPAKAMEAMEQLSGQMQKRLAVAATVPGVNDSPTFLIATPGDDDPAGVSGSVPVAFMKYASSPEGMDALRRHHAAMIRLTGVAGLQELRSVFPDVLSFQMDKDSAFLIQRAVEGEDGRIFLKQNAIDRSGLKSAAEVIAAIHQATSTPTVIDEQWISDWIEGPVQILKTPVRSLMKEPVWLRALDQFCAEQRLFWSGKRLQLGLYHGDYSPGNIFFMARDGEHEIKGSPETQVAGILDWDGATFSGPPGLDICHLALTTRVLVRSEELGFVVRDIMTQKCWEPGELDWMIPKNALGQEAAWMATDPQAVRAIVGLAWLNHSAGNLRKGRHFTANRLWAFNNIEWVLREYAKTELENS